MSLTLPSEAGEHVLPEHGGKRGLLDTPLLNFCLESARVTWELFKLWADDPKMGTYVPSYPEVRKATEEVGVNNF